MPEPVQDVVPTLFQPFAMLAQAMNQLAPHVVLAKMQAMMAPQPAPPSAEAKRVGRRATYMGGSSTEKQQVNIGLYKQGQYVGRRSRVGKTDSEGYVTGLGDIALGYNEPPPAKSLTKEPEDVPSAIGLANIAATNVKGIEEQEKNPATESTVEYTLYAPKKVKVEAPHF